MWTQPAFTITSISAIVRASLAILSVEKFVPLAFGLQADHGFRADFTSVMTVALHAFAEAVFDGCPEFQTV